MSETVELVREAVRSIRGELSERPQADAVVEALLALEKQSKRDREPLEFDRLLGTWRLGFVTGTQKSRQRAGVVLGAGRYLPRWLDIRLTYSQGDRRDGEPTPEWDAGRVENSVKVGGLRFTLTGPVKFVERNRLLAFDFTRATVQVFGRTLFEGYVRNGKERDRCFYDTPVKQQAFFKYFWVGDTGLGARGRGGGLAIWSQVLED
ncbi:hypothetical protein AY599_02110 [Leptolyngbya valderiana BDU 20041]|nr:hypothetical protein AY599_02110 [Leptolyngbya valderiana BDU 20041]PPT07574.1 hypothetical protein CKA32_004898 [Geitlerinema sp. FC II]